MTDYKTLSEYGIKLRSSRIGSHKVLCPQCSHTRRNKKDPCLSVKIESDGGATWKCHNCHWSGGFAGSSGRRSYAKSSSQRTYRKPEFPAPVDSDRANMLAFFKKRGISEKTIDEFGIYPCHFYMGDGNKNVIAFPYLMDGELVNIKYRGYDKTFRQEKDARRTIYNIDKARQQTDLIIVEGEMDVLACAQAGIVAVTLPDGAPDPGKDRDINPNDNRYDALDTINPDDWERIIIATDADKAGDFHAEHLEYRFGRDRCWRVQFPTSQDVNCKDANDTLIMHGADVLRECINLANPYPIAGVFSANDFTGDVLDIYHGRVLKPISTGFKALDDYYKIAPGTFHVFTGIPNHGKSNFLDQILVQMNFIYDWRFIIYSPEHSIPQHIRRLLEKITEQPFNEGPTDRMSENRLREALQRLNEGIYFMDSGVEMPTIDWVLSKARAAIYRYGVQGLVIDPYNMLDATRPPGMREDEHIRDLIAKCKNFCKVYGITIWMVAHPRTQHKDAEGRYKPPTMYDISGASHWYNMSDMGITIYRDFDTNITELIVRKVREQGTDGQIGKVEFMFDTAKRVYVAY